jgi:Zn-dependent M28 family amino/carboxypeptidase
MLIRSVGTDHDRLPHTGAKARDDHEIPAAAIAVPDAELLHRVLVDKKTARVRLVLGARKLPDADSANVVGEVTGRERPGEIVLVGAHLDSWDLGMGAIDDGAGVAIVLETGRLFAALPQKPRRTLRVVLFADEEHGTEGAKEYARLHTAEAANHVAAAEADFGGDAVYAVRWLGNPAMRDRFAALARLLAPLGVERQDDSAEPGADVTPLLELGVPILDLRQDGTRYFDIHHSANDTIDKIDPGVIAQAAAAYATAAWAAAETDGDFGRVPEALRKEHR